jgi:nitrite reductase/ring-hydroxylating ferredoxin subunit
VDTRISPSRRQVVGAAAGAFSVCALAACGGDSDTAAPAGSTSASSPAAGAAASTSTAAAGAAGTDLTPLADVPVGGAVVVTGPDGPTVVAQPTAGNVVAFKATCTHKGGPLKVDGTDLVCQWHGATFEAFTGKVVKGPATAPLAAVPGAKVDGAEVVVS